MRRLDCIGVGVGTQSPRDGLDADIGNGQSVDAAILLPETVVDGRVVDWPCRTLAEPHSDLVALPGISGIDAVAILDRVTGHTGGRQHPRTLDSELVEQRIALESEKHFPFPLNDVAFDFQHLGVNPRNPDQQDLLLVACRSLDVDQLTSALSQAGLEPAAVDVETFSLERAFGELRHQLPPTYDNEECVAVVDIGATMTAFHVIQNGRIVSSRDAVFGGRQLTDEIMNRFDLSNDEAGLAKKRGGLPDTYDSEVLGPFRETLIQQIARSLQLYYTAGKRREVQRILLGGGTAAIVGLREGLAEHTGLEVIMANPFTHMSVNPRVDIQALAGDAPAMLTACGLAMRKRS